LIEQSVVSTKDENMTDQPTQRSSCRFEAKAPRNGTLTLRLELFHPVPALDGMTIEFELLSGTMSSRQRGWQNPSMRDDRNHRQCQRK
jgi:hypothetical protein